MVRNFTAPRSLVGSANNDDLNPNAKGTGGGGQHGRIHNGQGKHHSLRNNRISGNENSAGRDGTSRRNPSQTGFEESDDWRVLSNRACRLTAWAMPRASIWNDTL